MSRTPLASKAAAPETASRRYPFRGSHLCQIGTKKLPGDEPLGSASPPCMGMAMTIHRLTAGSGYDYLTRQVARQDATEVGHSGLGSYYAAKGEAPGVWVGAGMAGVHGLAAGDEVTAEHMTRLFGTGEHPGPDPGSWTR